MNKLVSIMLISMLSFYCSADVVETLKSTPASKYEVGLFKLDTLATYLTQKARESNREIGEFEITSFSTGDENDVIYLQIELSGRAKHMIEEECKNIHSSFNKSLKMDELTKNIFPGLSEAQYKGLEAIFVLKVRMTSRENSGFSITC